MRDHPYESYDSEMCVSKTLLLRNITLLLVQMVIKNLRHPRVLI